MAIDLMVMPLSRYLAGDFVTPMMQTAWDTGVPYFIMGPQGRREFPKDVPFGGPRAAAERERFLPMVEQDLAALPISGPRWDERSTAAPFFRRVSPGPWSALIRFFREHPRSLADLLPWWPRREHLLADLFLPCDFRAPFTMQSPFQDRLTGSVPRAQGVLARWIVPAETAPAVEALSEALREAQRLRLPLIVDV